MFDYIDGDRFSSIADVSFNDSTGNQNVQMMYDKSCIIFCKTDWLHNVFPLISQSTFNHILITHNSDMGIDNYLYSLKPKNIVKWFAQNVLINKDDLIPIPIGLERECNNRFKQEQIVKHYKDVKTKLVYMNHNDNTNPHHRIPITNKYRYNPDVTYQNNVSFEEFWKQLSDHKFVISPNGNGIDCHRTWEAMYVGTIPIVQRSPFTDYHKDFPMVVVDNLLDIDFSLLNKCEYFNSDKLNFSWWENFIKGSFEDVY